MTPLYFTKYVLFDKKWVIQLVQNQSILMFIQKHAERLRKLKLY